MKASAALWFGGIVRPGSMVSRALFLPTPHFPFLPHHAPEPMPIPTSTPYLQPPNKLHGVIHIYAQASPPYKRFFVGCSTSPFIRLAEQPQGASRSVQVRKQTSKQANTQSTQASTHASRRASGHASKQARKQASKQARKRTSKQASKQSLHGRLKTRRHFRSDIVGVRGSMAV